MSTNLSGRERFAAAMQFSEKRTIPPQRTTMPTSPGSETQNAVSGREQFAKAFGHLRGNHLQAKSKGVVSIETLKQFAEEFGDRAVPYLTAGLSLDEARRRFAMLG